MAAKSQVLADFIADWTAPGYSHEGEVIEQPWIIYCDGAWGSSGVVIAAVITSPFGIKLRYASRLQFSTEAVLLGLRKLKAIGVKSCSIKTDSKMVAGQVGKDFEAKEPHIEKYLNLVRSMEKYF